MVLLVDINFCEEKQRFAITQFIFPTVFSREMGIKAEKGEEQNELHLVIQKGLERMIRSSPSTIG